MSQFRADLLAQVQAFLRAESSTRKAWKRRAWLGRRAVFARLEQVIQSRYWGQIRSDDIARHFLIDCVIDALEATGALDLAIAGRWAEEVFEDPIAATQPIEIWGGQKAPITTEDLVTQTSATLNKRRRGPVSRVR